ncbi:MAG: transglycosylase SLT domain-containing protein [Actinomycetota bacterium]|nr:transglycosylase SLT domain-containing protein [Actinomycetota bacterium]
MLLIASALTAASLLAGPVVTASTDGPGETTSDAREWSVQRPNRGAYSRLVALASLPPRGWEAFAACVIRRESHGNPSVLNHEGSGAAGLVQFMPDWRHGAPFIVRERLIQFGMPAKVARTVRLYLSKVHYIHKYPEVYQRIAFAEVLEDGEWRHWSGHTCNGLRP